MFVHIDLANKCYKLSIINPCQRNIFLKTEINLINPLSNKHLSGKDFGVKSFQKFIPCQNLSEKCVMYVCFVIIGGFFLAVKQCDSRGTFSQAVCRYETR